ncbi:MAG: protein translocase subunit SecD [Nocardioides sp.]|nr:protein translocase subunit SecD [Nocardioides sp.]
MARKGLRPGRALVIFFLGVVLLGGLTFLGEQTTNSASGAAKWEPELGLDLQGGTRITLTATNNPTAENLEEARGIIDQRVNGTGVAEAEVTTQGNQFIIVEIPGQSRRDLIETVERQAQLRFRVVACSLATGGCGGATDPTAPIDPANPADPAAPVPQAPVSPGAGVLAPSPSAAASQGAEQGGSEAPVVPSEGASTGAGSNRAGASYPMSGTSPSPVPTPEPSASTDDGATAGGSAEPTAEPSADPATSGAAAPQVRPAPIEPPDGGETVGDPLTWATTPNEASIQAFNDFTCPTDGTPANVVDDPAQPLVTCGTGDLAGNKYLLSASMIEGTDLTSSSAGIPQNQVEWVVNLAFNGDGTRQFTQISQALVNTPRQFAVVLDGQVLSDPQMNALITNGQAQISGGFTQATAESLATSLEYGALPIAFEDDPTSEVVGPSLAGNQLSAGILAGGVGLFLVMLYCLFYYRGLGLVVISSLLVAAGVTYLMVLLLGSTAGFTLTLPGIAGLIIGVGVTADSFIIFFERIRDEMREGKTMRVAVESGWVRARKTRMAANVVSLLSALVLYIFATGVVKGFGFALGLSTLIDLAVLFWFTKPLVSYLARFQFFNGGGKLSGLSVETLGMDSPQGARV